MTSRKNAKSNADTKPKDDGKAEQETGPAKGAEALAQGAGAAAAEGGSRKPDGEAGAAGGTDGPPLGDAAGTADEATGKADEGQQVAEPGEGSAKDGGTDSVDGSISPVAAGTDTENADGGDGPPPAADGDGAGNSNADQGGGHGNGRDGMSVSGAFTGETAGESTASTPASDAGDADEASDEKLSEQEQLLSFLSDGRTDIRTLAWSTGELACFCMFKLAMHFDNTLSLPDVVFTKSDDDVEFELAALVDKIGARATPEILWNHLRLKRLTDKLAMTPWYRAALATFIAVYRDLTAHAEEQEALLHAAAPAPPKKPVDPDALTTGTVDGFFATGRTK